MGLDVTGGSGGISAWLEDLDKIAGLLLTTATTVTDAGNEAAAARVSLGTPSGVDLGRNNLTLDEILARLGDAAAEAVRVAEALRGLSAGVRHAAEGYREADESIVSELAGSWTTFNLSMLKSAWNLLTGDDPLKPLEEWASTDRGVIDLFADATFALSIPLMARVFTPDGSPVVTDGLNDVSAVAVTAPRTVTDLVSGLAERNRGKPGEISVSYVFGEGGTRHVIVDIPGTKSWQPGHTSDVTSLGTNLRAVEGDSTTYELGVLAAMREAGVTKDDDVMLVGHSEGGMIAAAAARDSVGEFHVSHVVTAGAPIGRFAADMPHSVQVLALENSNDVVPIIDGENNPDLSNVTTVVGGPDHGGNGENHGLDTSYVPLAQEVDASDDVALRDYRAGLEGFLDQEYMTTHRYVINRAY